MAEREGWEAVATRRLSTEIEYSQPVIYKHFASMEGMVEAIALEGFGELAEAISDSFTGPEHFMHIRGGAELIGRSKTARDAILARELRVKSEELTGVFFPL